MSFSEFIIVVVHVASCLHDLKDNAAEIRAAGTELLKTTEKKIAQEIKDLKDYATDLSATTLKTITTHKADLSAMAASASASAQHKFSELKADAHTLFETRSATIANAGDHLKQYVQDKFYTPIMDEVTEFVGNMKADL